MFNRNILLAYILCLFGCFYRVKLPIKQSVSSPNFNLLCIIGSYNVGSTCKLTMYTLSMCYLDWQTSNALWKGNL